MTPETLFSWPITAPFQIDASQGGTNSRVWRVTAADGAHYALRLAPRTQLPQLRIEAWLLSTLSSQPLSFGLPIPLTTHTGARLAEVDEQDVAILAPWLDGDVPVRGTSAQAAGAGTALAELTAAFAKLADAIRPNDLTPLPPFGQLDSWTAPLHDSHTVIDRLPTAEDDRRSLHAILDYMLSVVPDLYHRLPQQWQHRDYDPSNILMDGPRVTAVFDFEFAAPDLRVLDLAVALTSWPQPLFGTGQEWPVIDALGDAYARQVPLLAAEVAALPEVLRLRDITSLLHRSARYLDGRVTDERMRARAKHSLWWQAWIAEAADTLREHAATWGRRNN